MTREQLVAIGIRRDVRAVVCFILFFVIGTLIEHPPASLDHWLDAHIPGRGQSHMLVLPGFRMGVSVNFHQTYPAILPDRRSWQIGAPDEAKGLIRTGEV